MPITEAELLKTYTGAATHNAAQADPDASLGGHSSSSEIGTGDENLFDNISGAEAAEADYTDYRCIVFENTDPLLTLTDAKVYVSDDDLNADTTYYLCLERPQTNLETGAAQTIGDEDTAPDITNATYHTTGSWTASASCADYANGLVVGPLDSTGTTGLLPAELIFVWIKRVIAVDASAAADVTFTVTLQGDTAA